MPSNRKKAVILNDIIHRPAWALRLDLFRNKNEELWLMLTTGWKTCGKTSARITYLRFEKSHFGVNQTQKYWTRVPWRIKQKSLCCPCFKVFSICQCTESHFFYSQNFTCNFCKWGIYLENYGGVHFKS